jgi:hypothetical protein
VDVKVLVTGFQGALLGQTLGSTGRQQYRQGEEPGSTSASSKTGGLIKAAQQAKVLSTGRLQLASQ